MDWTIIVTIQISSGEYKLIKEDEEGFKAIVQRTLNEDVPKWLEELSNEAVRKNWPKTIPTLKTGS